MKTIIIAAAAAIFLLGCERPETKHLDSTIKHLQVTKKKAPKRFKVWFRDAQGNTYSFYKKRCSAHTKYTVGSWHYVQVDRYQVKETVDGVRKTTIESKLSHVCH